jgi:hypothetical protein
MSIVNSVVAKNANLRLKNHNPMNYTDTFGFLVVSPNFLTTKIYWNMLTRINLKVLKINDLTYFDIFSRSLIDIEIS